MTQVLSDPTNIVTLADLLERLGGIDPGRVRIYPLSEPQPKKMSSRLARHPKDAYTN